MYCSLVKEISWDIHSRFKWEGAFKTVQHCMNQYYKLLLNNFVGFDYKI